MKELIRRQEFFRQGDTLSFNSNQCGHLKLKSLTKPNDFILVEGQSRSVTIPITGFWCFSLFWVDGYQARLLSVFAFTLARAA